MQTGALGMPPDINLDFGNKPGRKPGAQRIHAMNWESLYAGRGASWSAGQDDVLVRGDAAHIENGVAHTAQGGVD